MRRFLPIALSMVVVLIVGYAISTAKGAHHAKATASRRLPPTQSAAITSTRQGTPSSNPPARPSNPAPNAQTGPVVTASEGSCHWSEYRDGAIGPDPECAPGKIDPAVAGHVAQTVCNPAWVAAASAARPSQVTLEKLLIEYSLAGSPLTYVVAQVVPVEDGGSAISPENLYPLPLNGYGGQQTRKLVADQLHNEICAHEITVAQAAKTLAGDWLANGFPDED
jgi:hypothetical protein